MLDIQKVQDQDHDHQPLDVTGCVPDADLSLCSTVEECAMDGEQCAT